MATARDIVERLRDRSVDVKDAADAAAEIDRLRRVCAEAYQFAGTFGAPVRVLDQLQAAAEGRVLPHESILPVSMDEFATAASKGRAVELMEVIFGVSDPLPVQDPARAAASLLLELAGFSDTDIATGDQSLRDLRDAARDLQARIKAGEQRK